MASYEAWQSPFQLDVNALHELPVNVLARYVEMVVAFEGPIHRELLIKRVRESAGFARAGDRMRDAILKGIDFTIRAGMALNRDEFLYSKERPEIKPRSREGLPPAERKFEWIAPEEVDEAILAIVKAAHSANEAEISEAVRRAFGFGRTPDGLSEAVSRRLRVLSYSKKLRRDSDQFSAD